LDSCEGIAPGTEVRYFLTFGRGNEGSTEQLRLLINPSTTESSYYQGTQSWILLEEKEVTFHAI